MKTLNTTIMMLLILFTGSLAIAEDQPSEHKMDMKMHEMKKPESDTYPIDFCPVSGEKLGSMGDPVVYMHEGREVRFCCGGCISSFEKDPQKYLAIMDEAAAKSAVKEYPLDVCLVSGEKLGGMGDPVEYVHEGQMIKFCCAGCVKDFKKNPDKYMKKLENQTDAATESSDEPQTGHEGHNH